MVLIDEAVRSILLANPAVYSMVGSRIYPIQLPLECVFPALSYLFPSDPFQRVARGARLQVDCWAEDPEECKNLKITVEKALDGYAGIVNTVNIEGIFPISPYDTAPDDSGVFHIPYDFKVIYRTM
ncbi:MAG: DUF3168 domain-containing protein [Methanosarcina sp.]|nr:DUF3168 domain-containing protein [Methanosarcina sp.]